MSFAHGAQAQSSGVNTLQEIVVTAQRREQNVGIDAEIALWGKNLTDDRSLNYTLPIPQLIDVGNFQPARTFGVDVHFKY